MQSRSDAFFFLSYGKIGSVNMSLLPRMNLVLVSPSIHEFAQRILVQDVALRLTFGRW